jgi:CheY-like chemotaxis protein
VSETKREDFLDQLHDALNHLYNADQLRRSPLAQMFGVAGRFDTAAALRKILTEAIDALKPPAAEPEESRAWRIYDSLYCCFIQQLNQQIVADQLCISPRQLRREQRNALEHLADHLWARYDASHPSPSADASPIPGSADEATARSETTQFMPPSSAWTAPGADDDPTSLIRELGWLAEALPVQPGRLVEEVEAALNILQPLAQRVKVLLDNQAAADLPGLAIHPAALNQILVSLLNLAIQESAAQGEGEGCTRVILSTRLLVSEVELRIHLIDPTEPAATTGLARLPSELTANLQIAADLARLSGARLLYNGLDEGGTLFPIRLEVPILEGVPVLVVDDNEDSLHLYERYASGTRYRLILTRDTDPVLELIEQHHPRIILLDIMMPKENGWIMLGRLRQHPLSQDASIIICTILPQEKLALSLGANAFLKKPVSREAFLQALDQQAALLEPEYS